MVAFSTQYPFDVGRSICLLFSPIPYQSFLCRGRHQHPVFRINAAVVQSPGFAGVGTVNHIEQPVIHAKIPVKPHGVVQAGHLHFRVPEGFAVGPQGCGNQPEIRCIGQHVFVHRQIIRHFMDGFEPDIAVRRFFFWGNRIHGVDRTDWCTEFCCGWLKGSYR
jgi:hypothetical protein